MATIFDVAEQAGVSVKTVSRYMNGYAHISAKTRDKVANAMEALDYNANSIARQMRLGDTMSIGMLYSDPGGGYQSRLNHAVLQACSDSRRYLAVGLFDEDDADWRGQVESFLDRTKVRNMILVPPMCDSGEILDLLRERDVSTVLISPSRQIGGLSAVSMNDYQAALEMTEHLIGLGHRDIAHLSGNLDHVASLLRRQGYEAAMRRAGLSGRIRVAAADSFLFRDALSVADGLLSGEHMPSAIFAANDDTAAAVINVAYRKGLRVPEDLSVAGFDDTPIASTTFPDLTTVAQPFAAMAEKCIEVLGEATGAVPSAEANAAATYILPHEIVERASTAPPYR